jgi:hypothetical protein
MRENPVPMVVWSRPAAQEDRVRTSQNQEKGDRLVVPNTGLLECSGTDEPECGVLFGPKADERPVRFRLEERAYSVKAVLDQWYDHDSIFYKVLADEGNLYILRRQTSTPDEVWDLVSFR